MFLMLGRSNMEANRCNRLDAVLDVRRVPLKFLQFEPRCAGSFVDRPKAGFAV